MAAMAMAPPKEAAASLAATPLVEESRAANRGRRNGTAWSTKRESSTSNATASTDAESGTETSDCFTYFYLHITAARVNSRWTATGNKEGIGGNRGNKTAENGETATLGTSNWANDNTSRAEVEKDYGTQKDAGIKHGKGHVMNMGQGAAEVEVTLKPREESTTSYKMRPR